MLDVVVHEQGLVTEWAQTDCVGEEVGSVRGQGLLRAARRRRLGGAGRRPDRAAGDGPDHRDAVAGLPLTAYVEAPAGTARRYPDRRAATSPGSSRRARRQRAGRPGGRIDWPEGPGYFWMAGESAQMRAIRAHLRRDVGSVPTAST